MSDPFRGAPASLRGAVDLSGLVRRANAPAPDPAAGATGDRIVFAADDLSFGQVIELSQTVPVLVEFVDDRTPATGLEAAVRALDGRAALARVDAMANPQLLQAFQIRALPTTAAVVGGRPLPLFEGVLPAAELADVLAQVLALAQQQGVTGSLGPASDAGGEPGADAAAGTPAPAPLPPLHQEAYDAIGVGDYPRAIAAYEQALRENPRDADAEAGLAQVRLLVRLGDPDDADRDFAAGAVEAAFDRLLAEFAGADPARRDAIRTRLLDYFEILGPEDERVAPARRRLTALLY